mmetsp:Transcript_21760/g.38276  ORF Transcript_21760/g.38276 Transcript_21760/m.38276 type:complete len:468 (-) Transcript_21760:134-1537(-)
MDDAKRTEMEGRGEADAVGASPAGPAGGSSTPTSPGDADMASPVDAAMPDATAAAGSGGTELVEAPPAVDPTVTNLHTYHDMCQFEALVSRKFQKIKVLASAIHGKVLRMRRIEEGDVVVVKKMANVRVDTSKRGESNDRTAHYRQSPHDCMEDALNEIGIFQHLSRQRQRCNFLLRLLAVLRDDNETWLVTESCEMELFDVAAAGGPCPEQNVRRWIWQLLQAVRFLQIHNIGHRDISLENCLLDNARDRNLRLMDFGQGVSLWIENGGVRTPLRYFRPAGKNYYRPPEAYVPSRGLLLQAICPTGYVPGSIVQVATQNGFLIEVVFPADAVPGQQCAVTPMGYTVAPMDMFAVGVSLFVLHTQNPPWRQAMKSDEIFRFIMQNGVEVLFGAWRKPLLSPPAMQLLNELLRVDPATRATIEQALANAWFTDLNAEAEAAADGGGSGGMNSTDGGTGDGASGSRAEE